MAGREQERIKLWDNWQQLRETTDDALNQRITELFPKLKDAACEQLTADAARFARLGDRDEVVYAHLVRLMATYRAVVEIAEYSAHENETLGLLMDGLTEVLGSRLKQFEDMPGLEPLEQETNPVTQEKNGIIDGATLYVSREAETLAVQFIRHLQTDRPSDWAALCIGAASETIEEIVAKECFPMMHIHYQEGLRFCLAGLDDLHARKSARFYTELIEREWEELGNIIKVQVLHLETAIAEAKSKGTAIQDGTHTILDMLRELYQHTGPIIADLQRLLNTPPSRTSPYCSFAEFSQKLSSVIAPDSSDDAGSKAFLSALADESEALFDSFRKEFPKAAYQLQRIISDDLLLAEEITSAFVKTRGSLQSLNKDEAPPENLQPKEADIQRDILKGITETVEIKIDSLNDSFQEFNDKGLSIIQNFAAESPEIPADQRKVAIDNIHVAWMECPPQDISQIGEFFENCLNGEIFQSIKERVTRQISAYFEKTEKSAFLFKKEVLLYEICTYEEILTHSVSRLRESEWETMTAAAAILDQAFRDLETLLKKSNIAVISPVPHEPFNAQEHEVLVAEKQDGYAKGEIIKIITSGYKKNDQIIIRANVIAAR